MRTETLRITFGFILTILFLLIVIISAWFALSKIKSDSQKNVRESLFTVMQTTQEALHVWIRYRKDDLLTIANKKEVINLTQTLIKEYKNNTDIKKSSSFEKLKAIMSKKIKKNTDKGFFIIAKDRTSIASMRDVNIGSKNIIQKKRKKYLDRVFKGETLFIPTIASDIPLKTDSGKLIKQLPTIFIATPIKNSLGEIIAVLAFRLDPSSDFTRIAQLGQIGKNGETYAFDNKGILITESRFDNQLKRIGLIKSGKKGILSIKIADPGGNMLEGFIPTLSLEKRPLTVMAQSAILGNTGYNIEGYRDYRGVLVSGTWLWDTILGVGLTTEIDTDEAMKPYYQTRITIVSVLILTVFLSFSLLIFLLWLEKGSREKLKKAYSILEEKVEIRTREFKESEEKFRTIFEASADAMILLDKTDFIDCNEAALAMFGYKHRDEFLNKQLIQLSANLQLNGSLLSYEKISELLSTTFKLGQNTFEWNYIRSNGEVFPAEVLLTCIHMHEKKIIQGTIRDISERKRAEEELASLNKELKSLSFLDGLTGIANRRMFDTTLEIEWNHAQRDKQPLSLIMIDIDFFKQYNDTYGHTQGDNCLKIVANTLSFVLKRTVDLAARYGGEEFAILLPNTNTKQASIIAQKCRTEIIEQNILHESSKISGVVTISIGVSSIIPTGSMEPSILINNSDRLLYKAKNKGRNRVENDIS